MIKAILRKNSWQSLAEFTFCFSLHLKLPLLVIISLIFTPFVCSHCTCHSNPILYFAWAFHVLCLANKSELENGIKAIKHLPCFQKSLLCRNGCWVGNKNPLGCLRSNQRCTLDISICLPVLGGQSQQLAQHMFPQLSGAAGPSAASDGRS